MDIYQEKTGTMTGEFKGKLYVTGFEIEKLDLHSEVWMEINGEWVKVNVTIKIINGSFSWMKNTEFEVDETAEFPGDAEDEAFLTLEYAWNLSLD
jgi:hypothetical protein